MKYRNMLMKYGPTASVGFAAIGGTAMAQSSSTNFSSILSGLDASTAVTAILAAAVILALVGFAKWGAKKVGKFFG